MPISRQEASLKRFQLAVILGKTKSWRQCLCYFSYGCDKMPRQKPLKRKRVCFGSQFQGIVHGSYGRRGNHIVFTVTVPGYSPSSMGVMAAGT